MDDHDGIMTLLGLPDPVEKGLALKSKHVEPYHLRHALQDADPHIRAQAAKHPKLTRELVREVLSGDDKDLKHIVLARHDIDEQELGLVATDPDHALEVARHPKTTTALRQKALDYKHLPEGVKAEHSKRLMKSIGHITYPLLGQSNIYTKPMPVQNKVAAQVRDQYVMGKKFKSPEASGMLVANYADREPTPPHLRQVSGYAINTPALASKQTQLRLAPKVTPTTANPYKVWGVASKVDTGKTLDAIENHEAQHSVYSRLAQKHGNEAVMRIVATTLSKLPEHERAHVKNIYSGMSAASAGPMVDPEESIAYLHNYLTDPNRRNRVHQRLGMLSTEEQQDSMALARKAWQNLRRIGMSLRPEEVGVNPEDNKTRFSAWVKRLSKRESIPSDQLGFSVSFHELIAIAQFLTQQQVDLSVVRQALMENGGDPREAVLVAYGLNTPEGKKAFDSVKALKLHKNEDVLKAPKSIVGIDDEKIGETIKQAYANNNIESIALGGKHSSGSYIAKDDEGGNWLLKPGSGKKSPAAGVDETKGSQSRREAAFSAVAQWLEIDEVQPAHLLQIDGKEVAAIRMWSMDWTNLHRTMYEDSNVPRRALDRYLRNGKLFRWSVLDFIAGNPDRHGNNLMVSSEDDGNKIGLIDHGSAFAGHSFDPGNDKDSFVPYYLRVWAGPGFHGMSHREQAEQMPKLTGEADEALRSWVAELDAAELEKVLIKYGLDPAHAVARLKEIQSNPMAENMSHHVNMCWLTSPESMPAN